MWELDHEEGSAPKYWCFWTVCWRRLLSVPWTARRSNQFILKEISTECSLEGLMLSWNSNSLAIWYERLTHWQRPRSWERLRAGGEGDNRGWDGWTWWIWVWISSGSWWWTGKPGVLQSMGWQRVGHDWTELKASWGTIQVDALWVSTGLIISMDAGGFLLWASATQPEIFLWAGIIVNRSPGQDKVAGIWHLQEQP